MIKMYIVNRSSFVYNDEYYELEEGVHPERGFTDRKSAECYAREVTIEDLMTGDLELGLYSYDGIRGLTSLGDWELVPRLSKVFERFGYTPEQVSDMLDSWYFELPAGLKKKEAEELYDILDKFRPYHVQEIEVEVAEAA